MIHWVETAVSTYVLHPLHGNGYQLYSGIGLGTGMWVRALHSLHSHNCHEPGCWHVVRHGRTHCRRHGLGA